MAVNSSVVLVNAGLEALSRFVGDLNFELSEVPTALMAGSIVGACSFIGGLVGGRIGLLVGGGIGYQINNLLIPRIRNVGNMLRELATDQLRNLFDLLISGIQNTVFTVLRQIVNQNLDLTDLLERFGGNSDVQMNIIQTLINFFNGIHGGTFLQVTP
ncbi:protein C19orf12 homolog [Metopolophium dirhodum]|uniref:protein C19orf12 homolog n=1 Tax=Metopolophium dirhodum TaxID=44670 RepID=UPI00298FDF3D|nr:protein C19orf12 homolog [Metopolophium dirhodum]XP_060868144.1 protein C19orf12 homolog [Metopolophium dirhodum]XP_060868145.1 protein C19orf12 homolog [Metopolophium dirhodum]